MAGPHVAISHEIIAEPEAVWRVLTDLDRRLRFLTSIRSYERLDGPQFDVGTHWRETRAFSGVPAVVDITIAAISPGLALTLDISVAGAKYVIVFRVRPSSLGTRLEAEVTAEEKVASLGKKMMGAMSAGRAARVLGDTIEQDLQDIGAALRT